MMTPEEKHEVEFLIGPWLVGSYLEVFFQGILMCQFAHYVSWYPDDKRSVKIIVILLAIITTLKSVQSFALLWIQNIVHFDDIQGAIDLDYHGWWQSGNPLMVACIGFYVQMYFSYRLYIISGTVFVVLPIVAIFVSAVLSVAVATFYIAKDEDSSKWFAAHFSFVCAGDIILALATVFFLLKSKREFLPHSSGIIDALIRLTFQTVTPAAICALLNLIFSQLYDGNNEMISTSFNMILPKLYAVSMMWTLNARRSIREVYGSGMLRSSVINGVVVPSTSHHTTTVDGIEMEGIGPTSIQIYKRTETVQDVEAVFTRKSRLKISKSGHV